MQQFILNKLDEKGGRLSTRALLEDVEGRLSYQSFYRALNGLQKRDLVLWYKGDLHSTGLVVTKKKTVLLIDADSTKIANLALLKISSHHKSLNHNVFLQRGLSVPDKTKKYDFVYISCLFKKNAAEARKLAKEFPDAVVQIGGCGINLTKELPPEIECVRPDYSLYPEINYSLGYTSRGCPRSCDWCIIPSKEGKAHAVADIYQFYNPKFKHMILLDNNIFALPDHFRKICKQIIKEGIHVDFTQGLDIRLLDDEKAKLLKQLKISDPKFSWDEKNNEYAVMQGLETLKRNGINRAMFYILSGFNSSFEDDLYRANRLKELGQLPFIMIYDLSIFLKDIRYRYLRDWCNSKIFGKCTFDECCIEKQMASERKRQKI